MALFCKLLFYPWIQFEYQQGQLEREIENLSWKVERAETTTVAVSFVVVCYMQNIHVPPPGYRT